MILASIFIDDSAVAGPLPPAIEENLRSFARAHPGLEHRLFFLDDILALLEAQFSLEVLGAFRALRPYAYKADLARYCILHAFGGVYADLSYFFAGALPIHKEKPVVFRDFPWSSPWDTSVGVIFAPAGAIFLERAIELVCANVKRGYYGATALCPTGPAVFGKALAMSCDAEELTMGTAAFVRRERIEAAMPHVALPTDEEVHCLLLGSKVIAIKRKPRGSAGLSGLGSTGGNDYSELWKSRRAYVRMPKA